MDTNATKLRVKSFVNEVNKSSMTYEVKRTRAVWDDSLSIPGTDRRGGWRCPPGTRYGGQITDRFGRNCGWGVARRLVNELGDLGERLENIGDRRRERRGERAVGRREVRPGVVERAAGRVARALETEGDSTPTPPRGRRERQGPARRRPNLRESERRRMDREIDQPGAPRTDEARPERPARGRRRGNLRESEQRRMDREIEQPGAERTAPGDGAPRRRRPAAPRARRREATAEVGRDKPEPAAPRPDAEKRPPKKKAGQEINLGELLADDRVNDYFGGVLERGREEIANDEALRGQSASDRARRLQDAEDRIKLLDARREQLETLLRRGDISKNDFVMHNGEKVTVGQLIERMKGNASGWREVAKWNAPQRPRNLTPEAPRRVNIGDFAEDSRIIGGDFAGAAERIDKIDPNNELVGDAEDMERDLRAIIERMDRLPDNAIVAVPNGFGGNKDMKVADLRRNMAAAADAWGRFAKRRNKVRNRRNQPQRVNMRDVADNSQQIVGDFEGAAQRIDDMKTGWGVENPNQVADDLDAVARRLDRYPEDAVIEVPDADAENGVKDVRVGDLRENMKKAAAAWRRYAKRNRGGQNNQNGLERLVEINLDVDNAINVAVDMIENALGPQPFLDRDFLRVNQAQNRQQNKEYMERLKKIAADNPVLAKRLAEEAIKSLRQNMDARDDAIRETFRMVINARDEQTRLEVARRAILDLVYFNAQKDQLEQMRNLVADIANANPANARQRTPDANAAGALFMNRDNFLDFVRVEGVDTPANIPNDLDRYDMVFARDIRQIENAAQLGIDEIDRYIDTAKRRKQRYIAERDAQLLKLEELRLKLIEDKNDATARRKYFEAVTDLARKNYQVKYNDGVLKAYEKKREQAVKELEELGNESASEILRNENAVKEARDRVAAALKNQQKVLSRYLDKRYGKDNKPWLEMKPEKLKDLKQRAIAGDEEAKKELLTWAKAMYEHPIIEGTNGKNYQIVMDRLQQVKSNGDIYLHGTVYHVDENGRRTKVGLTEREIHLAADDPKDWYVKNAYLKIEAASHKKAGIATTYNQHAYMWAKAAGIQKAKVGTAWDGPYVWARAGFRENLYSGQINKMQEQLNAFRAGNPNSLIKNAAEAARIAALIREWRLYERLPRDQRPESPPVGHIDFIYALDIPTGRGKVTRQNELKEWFVDNMGLGQGVFDFEQNGITTDPRD